MPHCTQCGQAQLPNARYCENCGNPLQPTITSVSSTHTTNTSTPQQRRSYRRNRKEAKESLSTFIGIIGILGILHGLSTFLQLPTDQLLNAYGPLLLLVLVISITFKIIFDVKAGVSITTSLLETLFWSAVTYVLMYDIFWYLATTMLRPGNNWLPLPQFPTSTPNP